MIRSTQATSVGSHRWMGSIILGLMSFICTSAAFAETPVFVTLKFGTTASIDVPRTWTPLNQNLREQLKTTGSALLELSGSPGLTSEYHNLVAANAYTVDDLPSATMRLSYDPGQTMTQEDIRSFTLAELNEVASMMAVQIESSFALNNDPQKIVAIGGELRKCGRHDAIVIKYTRTDTRKVENIVEISMIFLGTHSIRLTLSCRTSEELFFRAQLSRIRESLAAGPR